jgi:EcsC protein family
LPYNNEGHIVNDYSEPEEDGKNSKAVQVLLDGLNWLYAKAIDGGFGFENAEQGAEDFAAGYSTPEEAIDALINWQVAKASATGFIANLGGLITLPLAIPANLGAVIFIQLNMIARIAHLRGYDVRSDQVRTFALACLAGTSAIDLLKDVGVQIGTKLAAQAIKSLSGAMLIRINKAVGFRLITKAGTTGLVNLSKIVPFVCGLVSGAVDGMSLSGILCEGSVSLDPSTRR